VLIKKQSTSIGCASNAPHESDLNSHPIGYEMKRHI